jgi:hypothetical protein
LSLKSFIITPSKRKYDFGTRRLGPIVITLSSIVWINTSSIPSRYSGVESASRRAKWAISGLPRFHAILILPVFIAE